ncbi:MAG: asparagine synthase [Parcubacteria group bacterium Gr01-1014_38]|nr:MAG: asparagine synthase [Parcubacteria group bacterium Gr01-1014_38]
MCGITGKIRFDGQPVTAADIARMNAAIVHRGPDDTGTYVSRDGRVGLGAQRLAIVDLTPAGHQPMRFRERYSIVFNGELYNFRALRAELEATGERFRSQTDTEVLLALYHRDGPGCLERVRGMFAFALYDEQERVLFCARDRIGKKPFKYYHDGRVFLFASELKALFTQAECPREPDFPALGEYLALQYVPSPRTGFRNIQKLEPGHLLTLDVPSGRVQKRRYWSLRLAPKQSFGAQEWRDRVRSALDEAVGVRLVADVPVGTLLSGGIDSSLVTALMARASTNPIRTFSVGFPEFSHDELPYARLVAERYGTVHTECVVEPGAVRELTTLVRQFEEPFGDSSALPTLLVCRSARSHVTVALTGDGGDENFGGYPRYSVQKLASAIDRVQLLRTLLTSAGVHALARRVPQTAGFRLRRFLQSLSAPSPERYAAYIGYFLRDEQRHLLTPDGARAVGTGDPFAAVAERIRASGTDDPVDQALEADLHTYLPDDLLVKMDLASMAVSLEVRSPLLDHHLLELTATMPSALKIRGITGRKALLKNVARGLVPDEILSRPKQGFSLPLDWWFRGALQPLLRETLLSERARRRGFLHQAAVKALVDQHVSGGVNRGKFLWLLLMLELWFQHAVDRRIS